MDHLLWSTVASRCFPFNALIDALWRHAVELSVVVMECVCGGWECVCVFVWRWWGGCSFLGESGRSVTWDALGVERGSRGVPKVVATAVTGS